MNTDNAPPKIGAWAKLPVPETVELLAAAGFDFVVIDNEHGTIDVRTASTMIGLARACSIAPFVRVAGTSPRDVQVPLDAGAAGLFIPQVDDTATAQRAVRSTRFPPLGSRGASTSGRAGRWGLDSLHDYVRRGNEDVLLVAQVESIAALDAVTDIGQVPGVDAVFIGPTDLTVSGRFAVGDQRPARLIAAAEARCRQHGIRIGTTASGNGAELLDSRGYDFVVLGADTTILSHAAQALVADVLEARAMTS